MFFIAFSMDAETHIVIPVTWVYDYEVLIEKFIRKSINRNQKCLIYYSKNTFHGVPDDRTMQISQRLHRLFSR